MKQGENWIPGVLMYINFCVGKKMEEGEELLYWHLVVGYPIGYFLNMRRTVILMEEYEYPQLGIVLLWVCLFILSGVISPLISCSILGTY